jgi:hypothetical protein
VLALRTARLAVSGLREPPGRGGYTSGEATVSDFPVPPGVPVRETADGGHAVLLSDMVRAPLPPRFLTEDQVRQLLSECITVVKPGETLVLRVPWGTPPNHIRELHEALNLSGPAGEPYLPFQTVVVPGDELAVAHPEDDRAFAGRVARALQHLSMQRRFPTRRA